MMDSKVCEFLFLIQNSKIRQIGSRPSKQQNFYTPKNHLFCSFNRCIELHNRFTYLHWLCHILNRKFNRNADVHFHDPMFFYSSELFQLTHMRECTDEYILYIFKFNLSMYCISGKKLDVLLSVID